MTGFAKFKTAVMELGRDMGGDPRRGRPRQHFGRGRPPPGPRRSEDQDEMEEVARMLRSFALEGGPKHTDLVVAQMDGQFIGGPEAAMFTFEWYRTTADGTFSRIPGVARAFYQLSADDIGARVCAKCVWVRDEGQCGFAEVGPVTEDPAVAARVDALIRGEAELICLEERLSGDDSEAGGPRDAPAGRYFLRIDAQGVALWLYTDGDASPSPVASPPSGMEGAVVWIAPHSAAAQVELDSAHDRHFTLELGGEPPIRERLSATDHADRDVVALAVREMARRVAAASGGAPDGTVSAATPATAASDAPSAAAADAAEAAGTATVSDASAAGAEAAEGAPARAPREDAPASNADVGKQQGGDDVEAAPGQPAALAAPQAPQASPQRSPQPSPQSASRQPLTLKPLPSPPAAPGAASPSPSSAAEMQRLWDALAAAEQALQAERQRSEALRAEAAQLVSARRRAEEAEAAQAQAREAEARARSELAQAREAEGRLRGEVLEARQQAEERAQQLRAERRTLEATRAQLASVQAEVAELMRGRQVPRAEFEQAVRERDEAREQLREAEARLSTAEAEHEREREEAERAAAEVAEVQAALQEAREQLDEVVAERNSLRNTRESLARDVKRLRRQAEAVDKLQRENARLASELQQRQQHEPHSRRPSNSSLDGAAAAAAAATGTPHASPARSPAPSRRSSFGSALSASPAPAEAGGGPLSGKKFSLFRKPTLPQRPNVKVDELQRLANALADQLTDKDKAMDVQRENIRLLGQRVQELEAELERLRAPVG